MLNLVYVKLPLGFKRLNLYFVHSDSFCTEDRCGDKREEINKRIFTWINQGQFISVEYIGCMGEGGTYMGQTALV
jgi:hypothetical protein